MRARGVQPLPCVAPTASVEMALPRTGLRGPQSPARLMRIAYLDCFSGISGDMFLGALLDAGVPPELLCSTVDKLDVGARLELVRADRAGINAAKVNVYACGEKELPREEFWARQQAHSHDRSGPGEHAQHHEHGASGHQRAHEPAGPDQAHGRGLNEIREIIARAELSDLTKRMAI